VHSPLGLEHEDGRVDLSSRQMFRLCARLSGACSPFLAEVAAGLHVGNPERLGDLPQRHPLPCSRPTCACLYIRAARQSCLTALPNAVVGLPRTTPPIPPALFVYALARGDVSTREGIGPRPHAHKQLGVWHGDRRYEGIILSFFTSVRDAFASLRTLAWLYGGKLVQNVVEESTSEVAPSIPRR
jgi:hypothetical protein